METDSSWGTRAAYSAWMLLASLKTGSTIEIFIGSALCRLYGAHFQQIGGESLKMMHCSHGVPAPASERLGRDKKGHAKPASDRRRRSRLGTASRARRSRVQDV